MKTGISRIAFLFIMTLALTSVAVLYSDVTIAQDSGSGQPLKQVDSKYVCMITNQLYDKEQIPVAIGDKTYYGCCQMCEAKLKDDPASRMATDPVSGNQVDKSTAVIGADPEGKIYYFESVEDLMAYGKSSNQ